MDQKLGNTTLFLFYLCLGIRTWNVRIKGFLSFLFHFKFVFSHVSQKWKAWTKTRDNSNCEPVKQGLDYIQRGARVRKEDVVLVMEKLGMNVQCDGDGIEEFCVQEIGQVFDDEDVTLSEVEEAFDVFDQNKDGFIEAGELQRVLSCLGLGKDLMECQKMINAVDQNGDELIDRNEFVRIMEQSFG
ncbi:calcium-binding protein CML30 [Spatholobus suberectus]|nr:calcium-binding protein CML30 [Spatholobus suberectus]